MSDVIEQKLNSDVIKLKLSVDKTGCDVIELKLNSDVTEYENWVWRHRSEIILKRTYYCHGIVQIAFFQ